MLERKKRYVCSLMCLWLDSIMIKFALFSNHCLVVKFDLIHLLSCFNIENIAYECFLLINNKFVLCIQ